MNTGQGTDASMHAPRPFSAPPGPGADGQPTGPAPINLDDPAEAMRARERAQVQAIVAGLVEEALAPMRQELQERDAQIWELNQKLAQVQEATATQPSDPAIPYVKVKVRKPEHFHGK